MSNEIIRNKRKRNDGFEEREHNANICPSPSLIPVIYVMLLSFLVPDMLFFPLEKHISLDCWERNKHICLHSFGLVCKKWAAGLHDFICQWFPRKTFQFKLSFIPSFPLYVRERVTKVIVYDMPFSKDYALTVSDLKTFTQMKSLESRIPLLDNWSNVPVDEISLFLSRIQSLHLLPLQLQRLRLQGHFPFYNYAVEIDLRKYTAMNCLELVGFGKAPRFHFPFNLSTLKIRWCDFSLVENVKTDDLKILTCSVNQFLSSFISSYMAVLFF
jgi:hypothetical protein